MSKIILATGNPDKVQEFRELLLPHGLCVVPQSEFNICSVAETGTTFVENAIIKARHATKVGLPAIADDSGLEVDALGGAPGVYSARYAGEHASYAENTAKLIDALKDVPPTQRSARYWCVLAFIRHVDDPTPTLAQGSWEGEIALAPRSGSGFGYDPIFFLPERQCTVSQLSAGLKQKISHRAMALRQLLQQLS